MNSKIPYPDERYTLASLAPHSSCYGRPYGAGSVLISGIQTDFVGVWAPPVSGVTGPSGAGAGVDLARVRVDLAHQFWALWLLGCCCTVLAPARVACDVAVSRSALCFSAQYFAPRL